MSLKIHCNRCKKELDEPGALVFSPPYETEVEKFHICMDCWVDLYIWVENECCKMVIPFNEKTKTYET